MFCEGSLGKVGFFFRIVRHLQDRKRISRYDRFNPHKVKRGCLSKAVQLAQNLYLPSLHSMLPNDLGILVVGHGTRKPSGQKQLMQLVEQMRQIEPSWPIEPSFLELASPTIQQGIERLSGSGMRRIIVVPILLFTAAHAKSDIPDAVEACAKNFQISVVAQTPSLGTSPEVIALSNLRYQEIAHETTSAGCPEGHCGVGLPSACEAVCPLVGNRRERIALAMVGRGTSDPEALAHMGRFTQLANETRAISWVETGFFAGGKLSVDQLLDQAACAEVSGQACDTVVVQPHLLFEGELMDQLRAKIVNCNQKYSDRRWILARCLGADEALARVFVGFVRSALDALVR